MSPKPRTSNDKSRDDELREMIAKVLKEYDLTSDVAWGDLDELSTHTQLEAVDVDPEGILIDDAGRFSGVMNVYVTLQYGKDDKEGFSSSDSFLGNFEGHLEGARPKIDTVRVDTSPFYE
jgi:hypothetical protein